MYAHTSGDSDNNNNNDHENTALLNPQPCLSSPFSCPVQTSRVTDGSRFTHHPHPERTHAHARTARSFALASPRASKRRRTRARSPQPSQGEAKSSLLHRDRDGRQAACANENARKARQSLLGNQSHARRKEGQAGLAVTRPNDSHSDIPSACMLHAARCCSPPLLHILPLPAAGSPKNHHHHLPPFDRVPAHALRVQSGWPRWRQLAHAPVRDVLIVLRAAALSWCDL